MGKTFTDVVYVYMFSGGDQLTAARARSGQRIRSNSLRGKDRLEGMVPVIEDWHAKVCLLGVSTCPFSHANFTCNVYLCRSFGNDFTRADREWMEGRCTS